MSEFRRPLRGLAVVAAMAALLVLGGCGRKGPLDPPPGASNAVEPQANGGLLAPIASPIGSRSTSSDPGVDSNGKPIASKGQNRPFILDPMLN
ncbi:MAG TPA: lipoprotein [Bauldia sp.]|nr:lipoprotein [Bauldia sp.]